MDNWIDLNNVPKKHLGNKSVYDWKNSIGCFCNFYCDGESGSLTIVDYKPQTHELSISYNEKIKKIRTDSFKAGKIRSLIGIRSKDFKISIGENFIDEHRNITITSKRFVKDSNNALRKEYQYHCNNCNWTGGWMKENHILNGIGCSCCSKKTIVPYINDVYTTNPEFIKYFKNIEDTHKTTSCSKRKFLMICPDCGNTQPYSTEELTHYGFSCKKCGDGVSYGEKYMYSLLKQSGIEFITQLTHTTFEWCGQYRYDFYIPKINTIVEVNGSQHYYFTSNVKSKFSRCLLNDPIKKRLAEENNIDNYICIDCSKSEGLYIKQSIIDSGLLSILNITESDIDWLKCDEFTSKSFITIICNYKNTNPELSTTDIGKVFNMARTTIQRYLQKGSDLGICIYDKEFERKFKTKDAKLKYYNSILNMGVSA